MSNIIPFSQPINDAEINIFQYRTTELLDTAQEVSEYINSPIAGWWFSPSCFFVRCSLELTDFLIFRISVEPTVCASISSSDSLLCFILLRNQHSEVSGQNVRQPTSDRETKDGTAEQTGQNVHLKSPGGECRGGRAQRVLWCLCIPRRPWRCR